MMNWVSAICSPNNSGTLALVAQDRLLNHFLQRSTFEVKTSAGHELNYVVFRRNHTHIPSAHLQKYKQQEKEKTLVLMHGFGLGLGFFYENFDALTSYYDKVIAVDWLGMGASSRTSKRVTRLSLIESLTKCRTKEEHEKEVARQVTDEFIDSLEDLRREEKLENFVLAGHSLGGYLVGKYAIKYPKEVRGLILISPVGIPEAPPKEERADPSEIDWRINFMRKLWNLNITPQALIRVIGSRGPEMVESFIGRRFANRWQGEDLKVISDYFYHITNAPGNGEYSLNALLEPIFVRKNSMKRNLSPSATTAGKEDDSDDTLNESRPRAGGGGSGGYRTGVFARNPLEKELTTLTCPILLVYGDNDWLYYPGAANSVSLWGQHGIDAKLAIVSQAGHHLYLDNSEGFNKLMIDWSKAMVK